MINPITFASVGESSDPEWFNFDAWWRAATGFVDPYFAGQQTGTTAGGDIVGETLAYIEGTKLAQEMQLRSNVVGSFPRACWDKTLDACGRPLSATALRRQYARRRIKQIRVPDPNTPGGWRWELIQTCAPRKMNFCNQRALGRAARRMAGFQHLASTVDKVIQRALKRKGVRSTRRSATSCSPRKCR